MRAAISEHVFIFDLDSYIHDEARIQAIKEDIQSTRLIQLKHAVDVDVTDKRLAVLFDERFTEEKIRNYLSKNSIKQDQKDQESNLESESLELTSKTLQI